MRGIERGTRIVRTCVLIASVLALSERVSGQAAEHDAGTEQEKMQKADLASVSALLQQLQSQVQKLTVEVKGLKSQQEATREESIELHKELDATKSRLVAILAQSRGDVAQTNSPDPTPQTSIEDRIARLEENQQLADERAAEQSQTKVESSSKYRLRLSGIVLFNTYANRGSVENQDFPELATAGNALPSDGTFGGSLRQSINAGGDFA